MSPCHSAGLRVALFIGWALLIRPIEAQTAADPSGYETFVVPKEGSAASGSQAPRGPATGGGTTRGSASAPGPREASSASRFSADQINSQVVLTLFPGLSDLSVDLAGQLAGRQVESEISPFRWLQGGSASPGYFQVTRGGSGLRLGDAYSNLLGSALGLRVFAPWKSRQGSTGIGLYQRLRDGSSSGGILAVDTEWQVRRNWEMGLLVAADSSWRLTQQSRLGAWQVSGFAGRDAGTDRLEGGLLLEGRPARSLSLYQRVTGWSGDRAGCSWSLGLTQQLGRGMVAVDHSVTRQPSDALRQTGVGLFLPLRRHSVALRWQQISTDSRENNSSGGHQAQSLIATLYTMLDSWGSVWASAGGFREQERAPHSFVTMGFARSLGERWSTRAELTHRFPESRSRLRLEIGYQLDPEWQVRLLFGPSLTPGASERGRHVVGAQLVRRFRLTYADTGAVHGQVLLDGKPYGEPLVVWLDQEQQTRTDARGQFRLRRCPTGQQTVRLDLASLPADLDPAQSGVPVEIRRHKTSEVTFVLHRVGEIRGVIAVAPDAFGRVDPTAAVGVTISAGNGRDTTTNAEGEFVLGGLPAGRYRVALIAGTLPPDYEVIGADAVEVQVEPVGTGAQRRQGPAGKSAGDASLLSPRVRFQIAPRPRAIQFDDGEPRSRAGETEAEPAAGSSSPPGPPPPAGAEPTPR